jgi:hypothetical protein
MYTITFLSVFSTCTMLAMMFSSSKGSHAAVCGSSSYFAVSKAPAGRDFHWFSAVMLMVSVKEGGDEAEVDEDGGRVRVNEVVAGYANGRGASQGREGRDEFRGRLG